MKSALEIIRAEHTSIAAVIHGVRYLVNQVRAGGPNPDFELLRAMLHYIDQFPEKLHHPKEDRYLFAKLKSRTHMADPVIAELEQDHQRGEEAIRRLDQALLRWQEGGKAFFEAFAKEVEDYSNFHWRHMRKEEEVVMPLAEKHLKGEDWREIDAAFRGNADPLIEVDVKQGFEQLFTRIVSLAPPPIGVGPEPKWAR
jgi:hemerythrin-like domain-containing protein